MSVNLIATNRNLDNNARAKADWAAITAIAPEHGMIFIDEDTVNSIARLLDGQPLSNGEVVSCYAFEDDDPYAAMVCAFGPSLLPTQVQDQVRDRLATTTNGKEAVRLFNEVLRLGLQISFSGKEICDAHIKGVNWPADEVEINRTQGNMWAMLHTMGLTAGEDHPNEVDFETFAKAVNDNGYLTDYPLDRLMAFVECGRRQGATHVYWA